MISDIVTFIEQIKCHLIIPAGTVFIRQNLTSADVRFRRRNTVPTLNVCIQMKQKKQTKTFLMISNWKKPLISIVYAKIFQHFKG